MSTALWYLAVDGRTQRSFGPEEIQARWRRGEIGPETYVYGPGSNEWAPLKSVGALAGLMEQSAPPPPPPARAGAGRRTRARC